MGGTHLVIGQQILVLAIVDVVAAPVLKDVIVDRCRQAGCARVISDFGQTIVSAPPAPSSETEPGVTTYPEELYSGLGPCWKCR